MSATATEPSTNGTQPVTAPAAEQFPVDSYREAAPHLRRPFTAAAVKFKVQATWPKDAPHSALVVVYIDARLAIERLNLVCPHLWRDEYRAVGNGQMWCDLTVDDITRSDVGEGQGKGLVSDALKRAAVKFGVGVSLYATPKLFLSKRTDQGALRDDTSSKGPTLALTDVGERKCRDIYREWLESHGARAFGAPLDHGDVEDSAGDPEEPTVTPERAPDGLPPERVDALASAIKRAKDSGALDAQGLMLRYTAAGGTADRVTKRALAALTPDQADLLENSLPAAEPSS